MKGDDANQTTVHIHVSRADIFMWEAAMTRSKICTAQSGGRND